jgi:hypothetical protein
LNTSLVLQRAGTALSRKQRELQDQHGNTRGGDSQKRLAESRDEIDFVAHMNAPLIELIRTIVRVRCPPMDNKRIT